MASFTDTSYPSIRLASQQTNLADVKALATCVPANGQARAIAPEDFTNPPADVVTEPAKRNTGMVIPGRVVKLIQKNPKAKLEGRGKPPAPAAVVPGTHVVTDESIHDHPDIGGKFTICVLLYGPEQYFSLHKRCLDSIIASVPARRMDLRIGSNELNAKSVGLVKHYEDKGLVTKHYQHFQNAKKYPVMREMFNDPACPITTKWIVWFDDDSIADRTPHWLNFVSQSILKHYRADNAHMYGSRHVWTLQGNQKQWYESRPWYKGRPWRQKNGEPAPNGNRIIFCTGGWWVLSTEAMRAAQIPDPQLDHNGGDYTIGEQIYQAGYNIKMLNGQKQIVHTSSVSRRGITTPFPGMKGFVPATP